MVKSYISPNVMLFCCVKTLCILWTGWLPFPFLSIPLGTSDLLSFAEMLMVTRFDGNLHLDSENLSFRLSIDLVRFLLRPWSLTEIVTAPLVCGRIFGGPFKRFSYKRNMQSGISNACELTMDSVLFLKFDRCSVWASSEANWLLIDPLEYLSGTSTPLPWRNSSFLGCALLTPDGYSPIVTLTGRSFFVVHELDTDPFIPFLLK